MKRKWVLRWSVFILGLLVLAFGIALTIKGKFLGIGPWDVFHYGLFTKFGFTIGTWSIISGLLLLFISSIFNKAWPQIGSFLNMMLLGLFIDLFNWMLPSIDNLAGATIAFIIGVILMGYGIGLYVSADFGAGPRDSFMLLIVEKMGWSIPLVRNGIEVIVFLIGWMLGGPVGIGTLFIAFGLGPILGFSIPQCKKLMAYLLKQKDQLITT
ncbi:YitT family protein [Pradoshia sp. D12]|uniref:YczE/YyaS/YitT family protein n=1 Tax=Bacillaceae TaxID=186817 RepID=UPI00112278DF|nr:MULTISPECIES: YitT family protein [Bacillaceae]QFK73115.1 YitT family protein [Pradoshia sp. D12]TPF72108.1 YitT family protein [Bacillus sp. D12]